MRGAEIRSFASVCQAEILRRWYAACVRCYVYLSLAWSPHTIRGVLPASGHSADALPCFTVLFRQLTK